MKKTRIMGQASCLTSDAMKIFFAIVILIVCLLAGSNVAVTGATTLEPLKVEFISPKEGETVHGDITIEAKVNQPDAVDYCEFYIQEPGAKDRHNWKDYAPPFFWGGDGQTLDTTMFIDGLASVVAFCFPKDKKEAMFQKRVHFAIDNGKPIIKILSLTDNTSIGGNIKVSVDAKDPKGIQKEPGISAVSLYLDGGLLRRLTKEPFQMRLSTCLLRRGPHSIKVVAEDSEGLNGSDIVIVNVAEREGK